MDRPASFVAVASDVRAYATHPFYHIIKTGVHIERPFDVNVIKGSIPFCGSLSHNGALLAFHNQEGEVQLISTADGNVTSTIKGSFRMIDQIEWTNNDSQLVLRETYGALRFFHVTGEEISYPGMAIPSHSQDVSDFCLNADASLLVCLQRTKAFVFDFNTKTFIHSFKLDHCIKTAQARFVDGLLGVRTDYGCFSLYIC
jgi:hypothetical protein